MIMIMKRVEILAPAGNMECFLAAINAGADAVYMAGKSFGARASANNFTEEEFIRALHIAHIHGRKIYLTLNTLIKEREWENIYTFLKPLYEEGLDGVIIQDLGLVDYLSQHFPKLPLHASTQMTITDYHSAKLLKDKGICRVVPARELSLDEIAVMKKNTGLEIETFIHGALCYCYSGQCLFSSYLGGRSGNRGRCAGPCRLPYEVEDINGKHSYNAEYPLSLKDLCTIEHISELIEAGIDSFKIEGRMKSAEYVAGVTAIYRKYVDAFYAKESTAVTKEDMNILKSLYLRSSVGSGYYYKHNGSEMISISDPSYNNQNQSVVNAVRDNIVNKGVTRDLSCNIYIYSGEKICLSVWDEEGNSATVYGDIVDQAMSRAAETADIRKQLNKTGGTEYAFKDISIDLGDNCFVPVKAINELRRNALVEYEEVLLEQFRRTTPITEISTVSAKKGQNTDNTPSFGISVLTKEALNVAFEYDTDRLYIPYDLVYLNQVSIKEVEIYKNSHSNSKVLLSLPRIIRKRDSKYLESMSAFLDDYLAVTDGECEKQAVIDGLLIRNLEELSYITERGYKTYIELDYTLYGWNKQSASFLLDYSDSLTAPLELSMHELKELDNRELCVVLYGYAPLMVAANCLGKTYGKCNGKRYGFDFGLKDRYNKNEAVFVNCVHCYNEIYNAVPTSLHKKYNQLCDCGFYKYRIDFSMENAKECRRVLDYYLSGATGEAPAKDFTTGHIDKGAI